MNWSLYFPFLLSGVISISSCNHSTTIKKSLNHVEKQEYSLTGSVERLDPRFDDIIGPGELPEIIADGFEWTEGPLWLPMEDVLIFSDIPRNSIFQWSEREGIKLYLKPSGYTDSVPREGESGSNGLLLDNEGHLILCQHGDRRIARMNAATGNPKPEYTTIAGSWQGKRLNSPNDGVYNSEGDLFFTDPPYGLKKTFTDPERELNFTGVFRYSAHGDLKLLTDKLNAPNGIGLSPDEKRLYVANSGEGEKAFWMVYEFKDDGSINEGKVFYDPSKENKGETGAPDGLKVRKDGIIFATGPGGVWIFTPDGQVLGRIKTGVATSNCAFDENGRYLYITADMYLMRIRLK